MRRGAGGRRRRSLAGVALVVVVAAGCAAQRPAEEPGLPASTVSPVPAGEAAWQRMPAAPLSARGGALAVWTGTRLLLLGGTHTDRTTPPCPPAASCSGPPSTELGDGAAWDPAAGTWTHLRGSSGTTSLARDPAVWSGTQALTRSLAITADLAAGTVASAPLDLGAALVYADPVWTGSRLVGVGWGDGAPGLGQDGPLVAEVLDPATGAQHAVTWPFGPTGFAEHALTAWTGREVIAVVDVQPAEGPGLTRTVAFDPATDSWRQVSSAITSPSSVAWDGHRVRVATDRGDLLSLDPASGDITSTPLPDHASGALLASAEGRLLLHGQRDYLLTDEHGWRRLPDLPSRVRTEHRTTAWAGEQVVVWGGSASGVDGQDSVNTAEGWTLTPPRQ